MMYIGLDLGEKYCGTVVVDENEFVQYHATLEPDALFDFLEALPNGMTGIAFEIFQLYPKAARARIHSQFPESQVIGVVKYIGWRKNIPVVPVNASSKKFAVDQKPAEKKKLKGPHEKDAYSIIVWTLRFQKEKLQPTNRQP